MFALFYCISTYVFEIRQIAELLYVKVITCNASVSGQVPAGDIDMA